MTHAITRHRHDTRRRTVTVKDKTLVTPSMLRILFEGEELHDFVSMAPDDHVKLFIPSLAGEPEKRDYTPRRFDPAARSLTIDFALHDAGPATRWAIDARPGDTLQIGGPRGSAIVSPTFAWWLLVGDETALPAIGRRVEEMPDGAHVTTVIAVADKADAQSFATRAQHAAVWVQRPLARADDPAPLLAAIDALPRRAGDGFVWVGAEARVARAVRDYLTARGHPLAWMRASGYWCKGVADAKDQLDD
jgi:NADPH-dependent ferric siderophore reductase